MKRIIVVSLVALVVLSGCGIETTNADTQICVPTETTEPTEVVETTVATETTEPTEVTEVVETTEVTTEDNTEVTEETIEPTEDYTPVFQLSEYERGVVECIVMGESGAEPYEGQLLVAYCILNGCIKEGVQPSTLRHKYSYCGWNSYPSESVKTAVSEIFDLGYKPVDDFPLYFYAPKLCSSGWHESQRYIITVGCHKFFGDWS